MAKKTVTKEEIKHIADLAKLEFSDAELEKFVGEFNNILDYVSLIGECDTSDIEFEHNMNDYTDPILQEDQVKPSLPIEKLLLNATQGRSKGRYIKTSRIVSKDSNHS